MTAPERGADRGPHIVCPGCGRVTNRLLGFCDECASLVDRYSEQSQRIVAEMSQSKRDPAPQPSEGGA